MEEELDEIATGKLGGRRHLQTFYRGDPKSTDDQTALGLENLIAREQKEIGFPELMLGTDPETGAGVAVRVGRYGPYVARGEGGSGNIASVPPETPPADFTLEHALNLIQKRADGPRVVGKHPDTGENVYAAHGRFGAYVQLGETPEDKKAPKPKRASLPKGMGEGDVDLATAVRLLSLPRELGPHPESGTPVLANVGRFGPYVQHDRDFRSLKDEDDVHTVTLERALELLAQPKGARGGGKSSARTVLRDLGTIDGKQVQVLDGRYGAYVTDGTVNATLPKATAPESLTPEQASELLAAKAGAPKKGRKGAKKAAKKATKKAAKKATKKAAKKAAKPKE
jgi:DNA topoisomerase-1